VDDVTTAERAQLLADCDVFASPSTQESFGITTLEAWSHAKPVVIGDGPAQRSIVEDGVSGIDKSAGVKGSFLSWRRTISSRTALWRLEMKRFKRDQARLSACGRGDAHFLKVHFPALGKSGELKRIVQGFRERLSSRFRSEVIGQNRKSQLSRAAAVIAPGETGR
jgi:glycosyltransferase involved in cell wall biosynthesis